MATSYESFDQKFKVALIQLHPKVGQSFPTIIKPVPFKDIPDIPYSNIAISRSTQNTTSTKPPIT
jgi:hypothetical protein